MSATLKISQDVFRQWRIKIVCNFKCIAKRSEAFGSLAGLLDRFDLCRLTGILYGAVPNEFNEIKHFRLFVFGEFFRDSSYTIGDGHDGDILARFVP